MIRKLLVFLFLFPFAAFAGVIKGKVADPKGEAMGFATIYVEGTTMGTNANSEGDYELQLGPGRYHIVCQYIGYKQSVFDVEVKGEEVISHNFIVSTAGIEMKEVVVRANAEDPAYGIIRNAIRKRPFYLDQIRTFQSSLYFKAVARSRQMPDKFLGKDLNKGELGVDTNGKGVINVIEQYADYYRRGDEDYTEIHSVRESGDQKGLGFSKFPKVISFYDDNVKVFSSKGAGFVSPVSDKAMNFYKFKLEGEIREQDRVINKIKVTPKDDYCPCFNGYIYITDSGWAIQSVDLTLAKRPGMNFFDTVRLAQVYLPASADTWVIKSQYMYLTVKIFAFDLMIDATTLYNNQRINQTIPDSLLSGKIATKYDATAIKKDSTYWSEARPIPMAADELKDFTVKDSLLKVQSAPAYMDSVRRKENKFKPIGFAATGYSYTLKGEKTTVSINPLLIGLLEDNILNYNTVEGFNVAPRLHIHHKTDTQHYVHADVAARYGFHNTHFNAIGRLYFQATSKHWVGRTFLYGFEAGQYVFQYSAENPVTTWFNTYATLLYRQNDLKIYERKEFNVFASRNYGNGLKWLIRASVQERMPLSNTTNYSLFLDKEGEFSTNTPVGLLQRSAPWQQHRAAILYASVSWQPGTRYIQLPDARQPVYSTLPVFTFTWQKGIPGILDSKTDYDKWRLDVKGSLRLGRPGSLLWKVTTGGFTNTRYVAIPDLMHLYGNRGIGYAAPYLSSFQFAPYYLFSNKEQAYGAVHLEHHLGSWLSSKVPLLRQARWNLLWGGNGFYASADLYYTEAFVGLENIGVKSLRVLRIDFVQSWDSYMGRNSGIRFGLGSISFAASNPVQGDW
jgi:hypothetical protein